MTAPLLAGCNAAQVCGTTQASVYANDGGVYRCVEAVDCPRPGNTTVCPVNGLPEQVCVQCVNTGCQTITPTRCKI